VAPADPRYRPDIDGLRAIAVAIVVLFHAGVPGFAGGFVGVDVFFVISGFLVTGVIQRELEAGTFSWSAFMARRVRRLLPAVALMLAVTSAFALVLLTPQSLIAFGKSAAATTLWGANIYFWQTATYFAEASEFTPLLHMWSLAVEEQYYLLAPPLALVAVRALPSSWQPRSRHLAVVFALLGASFCFGAWSLHRWPTSTFFMVPGRAWELAVGASIALAPRWTLRNAPASIVSLGGIAVLVVTVLLFDEETLFPGLAALAPVLGASLILAPSQDGGIVRRALSTAPAVWLGRRSYALYLWHWPLLVFARHALQRQLSLTESLVVVVVSLVAAEITFRRVEDPLRRSALPALRFAIASMLCGVCAATSIDAAHGLRWRFTKPVPPAFSRTGEVDEGGRCSMDSRVVDPPWGDRECILGGGEGAMSVLLWGDSLAGHYRFGFKAKPIDASVFQYTTTVCPPIVGWTSAARPGCPAFNERAARLVEEGCFDVVVLAARWEYVVPRSGGLNNLTTTITRLQANGAKVIVVGQTPVFPMDVRALYLRADGDVLTTSASTTAHIRINERLRSALPEGVTFIDPSTALCDGDRCRYREDGEFLFHDAAHLSGAGSLRVVERAIAPAIRRATRSH